MKIEYTRHIVGIAFVEYTSFCLITNKPIYIKMSLKEEVSLIYNGHLKQMLRDAYIMRIKENLEVILNG